MPGSCPPSGRHGLEIDLPNVLAKSTETNPRGEVGNSRLHMFLSRNKLLALEKSPACVNLAAADLDLIDKGLLAAGWHIQLSGTTVKSDAQST